MLLFGLGIGVILVLTLWLILLLLSIAFYKRGLEVILPFLIIGTFITTIIYIWPKEKCKNLAVINSDNNNYFNCFNKTTSNIFIKTI
uniref:Transmembrane protein 218 n=1 Tax=Strongyloides stercoralis TaxID=6248 RepID=A0A0K0EGL1_STRER